MVSFPKIITRTYLQACSADIWTKRKKNSMKIFLLLQNHQPASLCQISFLRIWVATRSKTIFKITKQECYSLMKWRIENLLQFFLPNGKVKLHHYREALIFFAPTYSMKKGQLRSTTINIPLMDPHLAWAIQQNHYFEFGTKTCFIIGAIRLKNTSGVRNAENF